MRSKKSYRKGSTRRIHEIIKSDLKWYVMYCFTVNDLLPELVPLSNTLKFSLFLLSSVYSLMMQIFPGCCVEFLLVLHLCTSDIFLVLNF